LILTEKNRVLFCFKTSEGVGQGRNFIRLKQNKRTENSLYSLLFIYYLSPRTRQSIQHTLYERLLVYISFYLITRDIRYRQGVI